MIKLVVFVLIRKIRVFLHTIGKSFSFECGGMYASMAILLEYLSIKVIIGDGVCGIDRFTYSSLSHCVRRNVRALLFFVHSHYCRILSEMSRWTVAVAVAAAEEVKEIRHTHASVDGAFSISLVLPPRSRIVYIQSMYQ